MNIANKLMIALTAGVCLVQIYLWYGPLPDILPSHFDGAGQVDGEMGKTGFYVLFVGMHLSFLVGFPMLGSLLKRLPNSVINIPHKEYWLAPERREQTLSTSVVILSTIGWITSWLFIAIFHLSANVAIGQRENINPEVYWLTGIYMIAILGFTAWMMMKFRLPKFVEQVQAHST